MIPTFPTVLYEDDDLTACGILLSPDTDDAEVDVITASLPRYLDEWEDDHLDPDQLPVPTTWFVRRGAWAWEDNPDVVGQQILVPADPEQDDAFNAVLLDRYDPWCKVCALHPGLMAEIGVPDPTTPDGHPYTYLCQACADRDQAQRGTWDQTYLRLLGIGLPHDVVADLLGARPAMRLIPDDNTVLSVEDLQALPIGARVFYRASTWERVPCDDALPGGVWDHDGRQVSGQRLVQDGPVRPLVAVWDGAS